MRRASTLAAVLAAAGGLLLADAAAAQSSPRTLSWPGRGDPTPPDSREPAQPASASRDLRRPNPVIPHGGATRAEATPRGLTPAPGPARRTLTPANAWLRPSPPPEPAPAPAVAVAPTPAAPPSPRPGPEYLPDGGGRGQPAPAEVISPAPAARADEVDRARADDPMAPRRDALIFQMQQSAPPPTPEYAPEPAPTAARAEAPPQPRTVMEVASSGEAPPRQGGRYYSVHRQNGREPDALSMPEPTYVDGLVVSQIETIASQDLAAPEQGPTLIRDRNGNIRSAPAPSDGDHQ